MTHNEFNKVLESTLKQVRDVLESKSKEYATDDNKMHNFDRGARMTGESREKVLYGMALKHHISIADMRDQVEKGKLPSLELLNEKFGDAINYLILEKASIVDRINKQVRAAVDKWEHNIIVNGAEVISPFAKCSYTPPVCADLDRCEPIKITDEIAATARMAPLDFEEYRKGMKLNGKTRSQIEAEAKGCDPSSGCGLDSALCNCQ